jgi:hypothetical protein
VPGEQDPACERNGGQGKRGARLGFHLQALKCAAKNITQEQITTKKIPKTKRMFLSVRQAHDAFNVEGLRKEIH